MNQVADNTWAILDPVDQVYIVRHLREEKIDHVSLYQGTAQEKYWDLAPYLVRMDNALLQWLREYCWQTPWGIIVRSPASRESLRKHFRRLVMVKDRDGEWVFFRFYDPRVLPAFLPSCIEKQLDEMFGPVEEFWTQTQKTDDFRVFAYER